MRNLAAGVVVGILFGIAATLLAGPSVAARLGQMLVKWEREGLDVKRSIIGGVSLAIMIAVLVSVLSAWLAPDVTPWLHPDFTQ